MKVHYVLVSFALSLVFLLSAVSFQEADILAPSYELNVKEVLQKNID